MALAPLVKWAMAKQKVIGLTDRAFAGRIGISQPQWSRIKHGMHEPTLPFARKLTATFPEDGETIKHLAFEDRLPVCAA